MPSASTISAHASKPRWKATTPASGRAISIASRISVGVSPRSALRLPGGGELGLYEPSHPVTI